MSIEFHYPAGGSYTANWTPTTADPVVGGSGQDVDSGVTGDVMADGVTQFAYQVADAHLRYVLAFDGMSNTDKGALETFLAAAGGASFDYKDGTCGPITSYAVVQVAKESFRRQWRQQPGGHWSGTLVLMDAD